MINSRQLALWVVSLAQEKKAEDLIVLDMRKLISFCDFFVLCTTSSSRKAVAVADFIQEHFKEKGFKVQSVQGKREGTWILLDFSDIVVHIFLKEARDYYALDRLWSDAKKIHVP